VSYHDAERCHFTDSGPGATCAQPDGPARVFKLAGVRAARRLACNVRPHLARSIANFTGFKAKQRAMWRLASTAAFAESLTMSTKRCALAELRDAHELMRADS
jgi:hypothetical protein